MKMPTTHTWIKTLLAVMIGGIISGCGGGGNHAPVADGDFNLTLDVNKTTVTANW